MSLILHITFYLRIVPIFNIIKIENMKKRDISKQNKQKAMHYRWLSYGNPSGVCDTIKTVYHIIRKRSGQDGDL